ncbi:MAG: tRNA lysidine(34) synthetase TilS, partial [Saprospiraceae bacterium]|nr:tRNA lysidine(34) synthetase TilS [Saprospiraceae bacterium]
MFNRFLNHIESKNLIPSGSKVLLACSGGMDSSVLFHLLLRAHIPFSVAHVDHLTREGDSTADAIFVQQLCESYNIECHLYQLSHPDNSTVNFQSFAHDKRYAFFQSLAYDIILTAHHQDDIVESIFLNFVQGRSLGGIYEQLGNVVRPLLPFSRSEISDFAFENDIPYVEDYSNLDNSYDRNFIRNEILPLLSSRFENVSNRIIGLSENYAEQQKLIKDLIQIEKNDHGRYNLGKGTIRKAIAPAAMLYAGLHAFGFSRKQCREVIKALASVGAQIQSSSHILTIDRTHIYIDPISKAKSIIAFDYRDVQHLSFGQYEFTFKVCTQAAH